jgi:hypothetical protein
LTSTLGPGHFAPCNLAPGLGQLLLPVLDGEDPLRDFEPTDFELLAQIAGVIKEFSDFLLAGTGRRLGGGARRPAPQHASPG